MRCGAALFLMSFLVFQKTTIFIQGFNPTLTFQQVRHFQLTDGSVLKYDVSAVSRFSDVNGDGLLDILVASDGRLWIHLGVGNGMFEKKQAIKTTDGQDVDTGMRGNRKTSMAYSDMNNDSMEDILICKGNDLYLYTRSGTDMGLPVFGPQVLLGYLEANRFDVMDWERDGDKDIIVGTFHGEFKVYHIFNHRLSKPTTISEFKAASPYNSYPRVLDVNGDGIEEILYSLNWGYFTILTNVSNEFKSFKLNLENGDRISVRTKYKENHAPELADVDGDGVMDLISSGDTGDIVFFRGIDGAKVAQENIINTLTNYSTDLGYVMENESSVYDIVYDNNRELQYIINYEIYSAKIKKDIFLWYINLVSSFPQYFSRQRWQQPCLAALAGYVWIIILESQPDSREHWKLVSAATRHSGYAGKLLEDRGIILMNNDGADEDKVRMIYDFMMMKNPDYYSLSSISQNGYLEGRLEKYNAMRHSGVNIFSGGFYGSNSFPEDCQVCKEEGRSPIILAFLATLAHEVAHNELDQTKAKAFNSTLYQRKYEIIKKATEGHVIWKELVTAGYDKSKTQEHFRNHGWWDGLSNWEETFEEHFDSGSDKNLSYNSIRPFSMAFFLLHPQEAFATLANQYASDTKLMLDFALERARNGHTLCVDWFLLMADYYSLGGTNIPILFIDSDGKMNKSEAAVSRDNSGYINHIRFEAELIGLSNYNCQLDEEGFVESCSSF